MRGELWLPGSKSLSNRVLLLSSLSSGQTTVENLLDSDDTTHMIAALKQLKIPLIRDFDKKTAVIEGLDGPVVSKEPQLIFLGNAGTAMRPLTAVLSAGKGRFVLDGIQRMRERPIIDLVDGLQQLGVDIKCSETGCPPVTIEANSLAGGVAEISGKISSQFLSALLMASPLAIKPVRIVIKDELLSLPYVLMTIQLMSKFGVKVTNIDNKVFEVKPSKYVSPGRYFIEGDASSASYFLAGAAISGGSVTVHGVGSESLQGDKRFAKVLEKMGATVTYCADSISLSNGSNRLNGIDEDCSDIPDVAMTLAIVGIFARGKTVIRNVSSWRVKETERMVAMVNELTKLGVKVEEGQDYLIVHGLEDGQTLNENCRIETYDDHRMAMCFSLVACGGVPVTILDPGCTRKTFPTYFEELMRLSVR
eukprot:CAMPEP_0173148018 /NCGR_PEP_ID=MMETSP1105-20130129/9467_1 /TAXON_ID=2985 /ORGANISM="Ochromonas sp., Strain BG-1" /LENGTH=420 /DNA_ID=CAMNT_0014062587 /DNA_START=121 /DNA_END=1383 /DNA_ORIENTATION=+